MPGTLSILRALGQGLGSGSLLGQLLLSLLFIVGGLVVAAFLALLMVLATRMIPGARSAVSFVTSVLHPLPGVALLPVVILWAGVGPVATLVVVTHSVLWPLVTSLDGGINAVPDIHRLVARNLGLDRWRVLLVVELPASLSAGISGARIAWSRGWRAFISAEMIFGAVAGSGGLGWYLFNRRVFMDSAGLFAGLVLVMAVGVVVERGLFAWLERGTVEKWGMSWKG